MEEERDRQREFEIKQNHLKLSFLEWMDSEFKKDDKLSLSEIECAIFSELASLNRREVLFPPKQNNDEKS